MGKQSSRWLLWAHALAAVGLAATLVQGACTTKTNVDDDATTTGTSTGAYTGSGGFGGENLGGAGGGGGAVVDTDPQDLDAVHGDPSLDVVASESYVSNGRHWVRVEFAGDWPPPDFYSWFVTIYLQDENGDVVAYTVQLHDGQSDTFAEGIMIGDVTFIQEAKGFRALFGGGMVLAVDLYEVECGMLKTSDGTFVQDTAGPYALSTVEAPFPM